MSLDASQAAVNSGALRRGGGHSAPPSAGKTPLQAAANGIDEMIAVAKNIPQEGLLNLAQLSATQLAALRIEIPKPGLHACGELLKMGPIAQAAMKQGKTGVDLAASIIRGVLKTLSAGKVG